MEPKEPVPESQSLGRGSDDKKAIAERFADETLRLVEEHGDKFGPLTPEAARKLKRKTQRWLLFVLCFINLMLFVDKSTLSYGWFLGIYQDTGIDDTQYNNLNTIFYAGYMVGQVPGHLLIQRLPLGKFVGGTVFLWSVVTFLHCAAHNYGGLIALRFLLGLFESVLLPAIQMTMGMFFPPEELSRLQPLFWVSCLGAPVVTGFLAYGLLFSPSTAILPWKFFMIITGGITFLLSIYAWFFYPDNPAEARFLTLEEKVQTIRRVHAATKASIEQKTFKMYQLREAMRDAVTWLFFASVFCLMIANNLLFQQSILLGQLGIGNFGSTLVSAAGGVFSTACAVACWLGLKFWPGKRAFWYAFWCAPGVAGGIAMIALPWDDKMALLAMLLLAGNTFGCSYIIALGWASSCAAGYTKKLVRQAMWMIGYSVANIISPQIWVSNDAPRYYGAWIAQILVSWVLAPLCTIAIAWILSRRNKERKEWIANQEALGYRPTGVVEQLDGEGNSISVEVDISLLDLTDLENKWFLYEL